jgi:hypothetical protein
MQSYVKQRIVISIATITNKIKGFSEGDEFVGFCGSLSPKMNKKLIFYPFFVIYGQVLTSEVATKKVE